MELRRAVSSELLARVDNYARRKRFSENVRYLRCFDDRMLADIGLTRPEIAAFVWQRLSVAARNCERTARDGLPCAAPSAYAS